MKKFYILVSFIALIILASFFIHPCDYLTGWGVGKQRTCECLGFKWTYLNKLPVDGDTRSICIGLVKSSKVFQYQDGL